MASRQRLIGVLVVLALLGAGMSYTYLATPTPGPAMAPAHAPSAGGPAQTPRIAFDKARAFRYLKELCGLGPRISATPGMARQIELLTRHFEALGLTVELQRFPARQRSRPAPVEMVNFIARWNPSAQRRILLCTHYDTRPIADEEPDPKDWTKPFLGANDGGSGVAVMMELAHHLKDLSPALGVDFVMFDGEEYIFTRLSEDAGGDRYFFGSEHFAGKYLGSLRSNPEAPRYVEAVLLDMVAGKGARFLYEETSALRAGRLVEKIWKIAAEVGSGCFVPKYGVGVRDDHLALLDAGIPAIDIVPCTSAETFRRIGEPFLTYPHWHRLSDTPENCSPDTMEQVGRVLAVWIQRAK
jgi:glutaminyl-peptide cyclotransferase